MYKIVKRGLIILGMTFLMLSNINTVKASELSTIENLEQVTEYANLSAVIETCESEVLGTINMSETENGLVIVSSETGEELVIGTVYTITKTEYDELCKIVQAEAGNQDEKGRMLVANVIMNRVKAPNKFGDNIHSVIFASGQFAPIRNGAFNKAVPTEETKTAVNKVLNGEDYSDGALYFRATSSMGNWGSLGILFAHGGHKFYK